MISGVIGACTVLLAAGVIGTAWAASYVNIDLTNTSPTDIDLFGDILYVLDDDGRIYTYTWGGGSQWDSSISLRLHTNNTMPVGILAFDSDTIYVLDQQGMVYAYGMAPHTIPIHTDDKTPVAITGNNGTVYVAYDAGELYAYAVQPDGEWIYDSRITLPVPTVSPSAIYVLNDIIYAAYVAGDIVHVFEYDTTWGMPFTISLENPKDSLDMTSMDDLVYVLKGSTVYVYDAGGNPAIEYNMAIPATNPMGISVFDGQFYILDGSHVYESDTWDIVADVNDTGILTGLFVYDGIGVYVADDMSDGVYVNSTHTTNLHTNNMHPSGITAQNNTSYVADLDGNVYVYDIRANGEWTRESTIMLDDENRSPTGVAINSGILYVVDNATDTIFGYAGERWSLEGTIPLHDDNSNPAGIALHGSRLYVVDGNSVVYSYVNTIDSWAWSHDIPLHSENMDPVEISVQDGIIHVSDGTDDTLYTYDKTWDFTELDKTNHTGQYGVEDQNIDLHNENSRPLDVSMYNGALYVLDSLDNAIYVYDQFNGKWIYSYQFSLEQYSINLVGMAIDDGQMYIADDDVISVYRSLHGTPPEPAPVPTRQFTFVSSGSNIASSTTSTSQTPNNPISDPDTSNPPVDTSPPIADVILSPYEARLHTFSFGGHKVTLLLYADGLTPTISEQSLHQPPAHICNISGGKPNSITCNFDGESVTRTWTVVP